MESKLDSYRKTKRRQALLNDVKDRIYNMVSFHQVQTKEKASHVIIQADNESTPTESYTKRKKDDVEHPGKVIVKTVRFCPSTVEPPLLEADLSDGTISNETEQPEAAKPRSWLTYLTYLVYFLFWATLYAIAIELRFGVVFLMLSALFGIYFNTRTKKAPGEISAYSVFNENCEAIDGTLKAEQFEREIGIRH